MKRTMFTVAASSLVTAVLIVSALVLIGPGRVIGAVAADPLGQMGLAAQLPQEIKGLGALAPAERFGHFLGGQVRFSDVNGASHAVSAVPGTVVSVTADSLVIKPNDGSQGAAHAYRLSSETVIRHGAQSWGRAQSTNQTPLKADDKVIVMAMDNDQARAVIATGPEGFGPRQHMGPFGS